MRCARVCEFCILIVLILTSYAGSSISPLLQGDGIFGSPVAPPVQVVPMVATGQLPGPPVVPTFVTSQRNWQDSQARSPVPAYPSQGIAYAALVSSSAAQRAGSPQLTIPHPHVTPAVAAMDRFPSTGQATGIQGPPPAQAPPVTPSTTSTQPAPSVTTIPTGTSLTPQDTHSVPSPPSDIPQPKRTGPWLFSATREKLLGAIHFMKLTEEQVSHLHKYHAGGAPESLSTAGSGPRDHPSQAQMVDMPVSSTGTVGGQARSETASDSDNSSSRVQAQPHTARNIGAQSATAEHPEQKRKLIHPTPPHAEAHPTDFALHTREAMYSEAFPSAPQLPLVELLQRQQLEHLQQGHPRGPQQQVSPHFGVHNPRFSEEQAAIHLEAERRHEKLNQQYQGARGMLLASQQIEATKQSQGIQSPAKHDPQSQFIWQQHRAGPLQHTTVQIALPAAGIPRYPPIYSAHAGHINAAAAAPYALFSGSEHGNPLIRDTRRVEGYLRGLTPTDQLLSAPAAAKGALPSIDSLVGQTQIGMETSTQQVVRPHGVEATEEVFQRDQTKAGNLAPQRFHTESQKKKPAFIGSGTKVDIYTELENQPENTLEVAGESLAHDAHRAEEQVAPAENSALTERKYMFRADQAETANEEASILTSAGGESNSQERFTVKTAKGETRLQERANRKGDDWDKPTGDVLEPGLMPVEETVWPDADEVKPTSETARTPLYALKSNSAASRTPAEQLKTASHAGIDGPDRESAASTSEANVIGEGIIFKKQVEVGTANASSSSLVHTLLPIADVNEGQNATPLPAHKGVAEIAAAQGIATDATNGEAGLAPTHSVSPEFAVPVAPSRLPDLPASLNSTSSVTQSQVISPGASPLLVSPAGMLRRGTPSAGLLSASTPQSIPSAPEQSMPPSIAPAGALRGNPAAVLFAPFLPNKEVSGGGAGLALSALPPDMDLHTGMPVTATPGNVQHNPAHISPSLSLAAMPALSYPNFEVKTIPVNSSGPLLSPVTLPAMLQPLPVAGTRTSVADQLFLAPAVEKGPTHYSLGASYVAPQIVRPAFPVSSLGLLGASRPAYVSPSIKPDTRNASSPAPIYIGQSIRQDTRTPSSPVYPLGARLYEQMIPRAEFFLASSTYAEEYLDLVAALYCLFHKWPCNNMKEFAEETRKRQEDTNSRGEGENLVA